MNWLAFCRGVVRGGVLAYRAGAVLAALTFLALPFVGPEAWSLTPRWLDFAVPVFMGAAAVELMWKRTKRPASAPREELRP